MNPYFCSRRTLRPALLVSLLTILPGAVLEAQNFSDLFPSARRKRAKVTETKKAEEERAYLEESDEEKLVDALVMRQVKFDSDWNPDPTAMPQFTYQFRKALRMRCQMVDEPLELSDPELFKWPTLYITAHNSFRFTKEERENLKQYLLRGGVLVGDDCAVAGGGWLPSFYAEMERMFPGQSFIDVSPEHPKFGKMFNISYHFRDTIKIIVRRHNRAFIINGRMAVYIILDDYGCMWEVSSPPSAANPLGISNHGFSSDERKDSFQFTFNTLLYLLTH